MNESKDFNCSWKNVWTEVPVWREEGERERESRHVTSSHKDRNNINKTSNNEWIMKAAENESLPLLRPSMVRRAYQIAISRMTRNFIVSATHINHYRMHRIPDARDKKIVDWSSFVFQRGFRTNRLRQTGNQQNLWKRAWRVIKSFIMKQFICRLKFRLKRQRTLNAKIDWWNQRKLSLEVETSWETTHNENLLKRVAIWFFQGISVLSRGDDGW